MPRTMVLALVALCLAACVAQPTVPADWQVVLHHDADGRVLAGSKRDLIHAVEAGRPVRLVMEINDDFMHVMDAGFLTVSNGEVFAQPRGIIRQIPERPDYTRIALDAEGQSHWHAIFSTTGEVRSFQTAQGELSDRRYPLKWVVYGQR